MNQKSEVWNGQLLKNVLIGVLVCTTMLLGGSAIFAALIEGSVISAASGGYCTMATLLLSSFAGALTATCGMKSGKLPICAITAVGYFAVLLSLTALFFGGEYRGVAANGMLVLCGCVLAAFLGTRNKKRGNSQKSKKIHRHFVQNRKGR